MTTTPNQLPETRLTVGPASDARLNALGVRLERLNAALDAGDVAARQADQFSPVNGAGVLRWVMTVTVLRQGLAADGWTATDPRNSPRITDPSGQTSIVPVSGNWRTGLPDDGDPSSARPRGAATSRSVQINGQLQFDIEALLPDMAAERDASVRTWFLLYYRSAETGELRTELSLPTRIRDKGFVDGWSERIILPPRTFGPDIETPLDAGRDDDDVEFDVDAV